MVFERATSARCALRRSLAAIAVAVAFGGQIDVDNGFTWSVAQAQEAVRGEIGRPLQAARDLKNAGFYDLSTISARLRDFETRYKEEREMEKDDS